MRYLVRCVECDQAFWQEALDSPVPAHSHWNRRHLRQPIEMMRCIGSGHAGYWIGEEEEPDDRKRGRIDGYARDERAAR